MERQLENGDSVNLTREKRQPTKLIWTRGALLKRLKKGPEARRKFVESQIINEIVFQIRALRHQRHWSQPSLAEKAETTQNQIYKLENPHKSAPTLSTLRKLAAVFDVGLVVRFVPYGEMIDYLTGTPRVDIGVSASRKRPLSFEEELPMLEGRDVSDSSAPEVVPAREFVPANLTQTFGYWPESSELKFMKPRLDLASVNSIQISAGVYGMDNLTVAYQNFWLPNVVEAGGPPESMESPQPRLPLSWGGKVIQMPASRKLLIPAQSPYDLLAAEG